MWPIGAGDARKEVQAFLLSKLGFEADFVNNIGPVPVMRIERRRPGKIVDETVVVFATKEVRDSVRASASKLAASLTPAGIRLEIPDYFQTNFRALENVAYRLKQKHPSLKRTSN